MKQMSSFSDWQMQFKIEFKNVFGCSSFWMFSVVMNHAADHPPPHFTCQKAAQLTTKSLQNHGMVDPSATDRLKALLVGMSQIDATQLGTDRPSGLKSRRHCLALISYVQIGKVTWKSTDQRCNLRPLRSRSNSRHLIPYLDVLLLDIRSSCSFCLKQRSSQICRKGNGTRILIMCLI